MYELKPDIKHIQVSKENIVAIIESINQPMVAASGRSAEPSKAYILGMRNQSGLFSVYVYLYLVNSHDCLVYLHDPAEIQMDAYHDNELEALGFVESMGFMVDNLNFRNMTPEHQDESIEGIPLFHADLDAFARIQMPEAFVDEDGSDEESDEEAVADLGPLEEDIIELDEIAEEVLEPAQPVQVVSEEGLAKIVRMFSSF